MNVQGLSPEQIFEQQKAASSVEDVMQFIEEKTPAEQPDSDDVIKEKKPEQMVKVLKITR